MRRMFTQRDDGHRVASTRRQRLATAPPSRCGVAPNETRRAAKRASTCAPLCGGAGTGARPALLRSRRCVARADQLGGVPFCIGNCHPAPWLVVGQRDQTAHTCSSTSILRRSKLTCSSKACCDAPALLAPFCWRAGGGAPERGWWRVPARSTHWKAEGLSMSSSRISPRPCDDSPTAEVVAPMPTKRGRAKREQSIW
eukprot:scaffold35820_cov65-Phaeocystis_antarctica.AAC.6